MDFSWVQTDVENIVGPVLNMDLISRRPGSDVYFIVANDGSRPQPYVVKCATRLDEEMHANSVMIEHGLRVPRVKRFIPNAFKERDVIISHPVQGSHLSDLFEIDPNSASKKFIEALLHMHDRLGPGWQHGDFRLDVVFVDHLTDKGEPEFIYLDNGTLGQGSAWHDAIDANSSVLGATSNANLHPNSGVRNFWDVFEETLNEPGTSSVVRDYFTKVIADRARPASGPDRGRGLV